MAGHLAAGDDLPGEVQSRGCPFTVVAEMLTLHVADRHRTDRRLSSLFGSCGRRMPRRDRARIQRPFIECADRDFSDAQKLSPFRTLAIVGSGSGVTRCCGQHTLDSTAVARPLLARTATPRMPQL